MRHIYKFTPVSMYDVHGLEKWLEKLAAQGLFLKKYRPLVCTFEKGEARRVRYRLEPYPYSLAVDFPDDMVELFQECGWRHVGEVHHEMLIFSCADPHAPEPHTDPDIQLEQWNKLYRTARKDFQHIGLFVLACLAVVAFFLFRGGTPLTRLLLFEVNTWNILLVLALRPLIELGVYYSRMRELSAVIRELEGQPAKHRFWFPSRQVFSWAGAAYLAFLACFLVILMGAGRTLSLARPVTEFPPLYVTDRESGKVVGTDMGGWGFSPLCWNQRQSWDMETDEGRLLSLQVYWFDFPNWLSFLAVPAAKDLLTDSMKLNSRTYPWRDREAAVWSAQDWSHAGADWLSVADSENGVYHTAAAALGDKVVLVQYMGSGPLSDYLDEIVAMVK